MVKEIDVEQVVYDLDFMEATYRVYNRLAARYESGVRPGWVLDDGSGEYWGYWWRWYVDHFAAELPAG